MLKQFWILMKQEMTGWQWQQLDHNQITCILLQTDNHEALHYSGIYYILDVLYEAK